VPYWVPEGVCIAITVVPGNGAPLLSVTIPFMEEVVTWANKAVVQAKSIESVNGKIFRIEFRLGE
jgi:shikimate 5-dehydrogenase